jgi:hypothetical protein
MCVKLQIEFLYENKYCKTALPFPTQFQHLKPVTILLLFLIFTFNFCTEHTDWSMEKILQKLNTSMKA